MMHNNKNYNPKLFNNKMKLKTKPTSNNFKLKKMIKNK